MRLKEKEASLRISELFYSIQGEGPTIGKPSVFIRLAGCNLECIWCDTKYSWLFSQNRLEKIKKRIPKQYLEVLGNKVYNFRKETNKLEISEILAFIGNFPAKNVVITGGEPLLQKKRLQKLIEILLREGYSVEIETNGTISPFESNLEIRYNVSPKLSSSFNPLNKRFKPEVLKKFLDKNSIFKFVLASEKDFLEVMNLIKAIGIPSEKVFLMPEGSNPEKLRKNALWVIEKCKLSGYNYSHRLHIELYGEKRGV